jgi:hypothetical protein
MGFLNKNIFYLEVFVDIYIITDDDGICGVYDESEFKKIYEQYVNKLYTNKWYWAFDYSVKKWKLNSDESVWVNPEDIK